MEVPAPSSSQAPDQPSLPNQQTTNYYPNQGKSSVARPPSGIVVVDFF